MLILGFEVLCILVLAMILSTAIIEEKGKRRKSLRPIKLEGYWNGRERRSAERLNVTLDVRYSIYGKTVKANSADLSTSGIRLILDEKIEKGSTLQMEIQLPGMNRSIKSNGEVAWSKESFEDEKNVPKRFFNTGIRFVRLDKEDQKNLFDFMQNLKPRNP